MYLRKIRFPWFMIVPRDNIKTKIKNLMWGLVTIIPPYSLKKIDVTHVQQVGIEILILMLVSNSIDFGFRIEKHFVPLSLTYCLWFKLCGGIQSHIPYSVVVRFQHLLVRPRKTSTSLTISHPSTLSLCDWLVKLTCKASIVT